MDDLEKNIHPSFSALVKTALASGEFFKFKVS
jgi:hypothetical protein